MLCTSRAGSSPSSPGVPRARVRSSLLAARESWRAPLRRCCAPSATSHRTRENIYSEVDTWRVGINQQYLYSSGEYLIFAWLFQRKMVASTGILTAQDSSPLDSARVQVRTGLESLGGSSRLEPSRVQGCLEPAREQHYPSLSRRTLPPPPHPLPLAPRPQETR